VIAGAVTLDDAELHFWFSRFGVRVSPLYPAIFLRVCQLDAVSIQAAALGGGRCAIAAVVRDRDLQNNGSDGGRMMKCKGCDTGLGNVRSF